MFLSFLFIVLFIYQFIVFFLNLYFSISTQAIKSLSLLYLIAISTLLNRYLYAKKMAKYVCKRKVCKNVSATVWNLNLKGMRWGKLKFVCIYVF